MTAGNKKVAWPQYVYQALLQTNFICVQSIA
jgi:hypothetical protein